jgi:hypothetical protein
MESKNKETIIKTLLDKKAGENNTIDLNAYANGLEAMYDALHEKNNNYDKTSEIRL